MRLFFSFIRFVIFAAIVVWLMMQPGTVSMVWRDYQIETSVGVLFVASFVGLIVLSYLFRFWRFLWDAPRLWRLNQKIRKAEKGQDQLAKGLIALSAGDGAEAGRLAVNARKLLGHSTAARLLQAQAAQLSGDDRGAHALFSELAVDRETTVFGYRGLIMEALHAEKWGEAERLVAELAQQKPKTPWLNLIRFQLAVRRQDWAAAQLAVHAAQGARLLEMPKAQRDAAALLLAEAVDLAKVGQSEQALQKAEQSLKRAPHWLPAIVILAQQQGRLGYERAALRLIEREWKVAPHKALADVYRDVGAESKTPLELHRHMEKLAKLAPESFEAKLTLAETALGADLWGEARRYLMALANSDNATQSVFRLLARLERQENADDTAATRWLLRMSEARPDKGWFCAKCGGEASSWTPNCPHCSTFNELRYGVPGEF